MAKDRFGGIFGKSWEILIGYKGERDREFFKPLTLSNFPSALLSIIFAPIMLALINVLVFSAFLLSLLCFIFNGFKETSPILEVPTQDWFIMFLFFPFIVLSSPIINLIDLIGGLFNSCSPSKEESPDNENCNSPRKQTEYPNSDANRSNSKEIIEDDYESDCNSISRPISPREQTEYPNPYARRMIWKEEKEDDDPNKFDAYPSHIKYR